MKKIKILFFVDQFYQGGAGRVASILINGLYSRGFEIVIVTDKKREVIYQLPPDIEIIQSFDKKSKGFFTKALNVFRRFEYIRKIIKSVSPTIIVAFLPRMFFDVKIASWGLKIPIIASDHTSMQYDAGLFTNYIRLNFYAKADALTILTKKDANYLGSKLPNKIVVYNPLTYPVLDVQPQRRKNILCAGRINQWDVKGFDRIIKIWGAIHSKYPDWQLEIAGPCDEKHKNELYKLATECGISDSFKILGLVVDMKSLYAETTIFALPSRVEGFPMVLLEAMSQGCACISFEMKGAINEIIQNNVDGIIVKDDDLCCFQRELERMIANSELLEQLSKNAINSVQKFSVEVFVNQWIKIITSLLENEK